MTGLYLVSPTKVPEAPQLPKIVPDPVKPEPVGFTNPIAVVRDVLEVYGWHQGTYGTPDTGFCLLGASRYATGMPNTGFFTRMLRSNKEHRRFKKCVAHAIKKLEHDPFPLPRAGRIAEFNDHRGYRGNIQQVLDKAEEIYVSRYAR